MAADLHALINGLPSSIEWASLRSTSINWEMISARNGKPDSISKGCSSGLMLEILEQGQFLYAACPSMTQDKVRETALTLKQLGAKAALHKHYTFSNAVRPASTGCYESPGYHQVLAEDRQQIINAMIEHANNLSISDDIVLSTALTRLRDTRTECVSTSGAAWSQNTLQICGNHRATACRNGVTQMRTHTSRFQESVESYLAGLTEDECRRIAEEAVELTEAEECPTGTFPLIIMPDQLYLQIHESIGHPLELDRILGDERNFAGWSFVKPDDFSSLQYGSSLMNVTFDPNVEGELASYAFDDCGVPAKREFIIKDGKLVRGLGSLESMERSSLPGVACQRSCSWNRAPIDRMANLNLEPGDSRLEDMIASVDYGVLMRGNRSWSIDDYRNKFQFGCEYGTLIESGKLTKTLKNPNYRGITVPFWHKLTMVGNADTVEVLGTPFCGKGEPNQSIYVGHSSPVCLFDNVEIFGGGKA